MTWPRVVAEVLRSGQIRLWLYFVRKEHRICLPVWYRMGVGGHGQFREFWSEPLGLEEGCDSSSFVGEKQKLSLGHLKFEMPVGTSKWKYVSFNIIPVPIKRFSYLLGKRKGINFEMKLNQITSPFSLQSLKVSSSVPSHCPWVSILKFVIASQPLVCLWDSAPS